MFCARKLPTAPSNKCDPSLALTFIAITALATNSANATMPALSATPNPPTLGACQKWAAAQDEDTIAMWGIQDKSHRLILLFFGLHFNISEIKRQKSWALGLVRDSMSPIVNGVPKRRFAIHPRG